MRAIYEKCGGQNIRFVDTRLLGLMTGKTSDPCYMRFPSNTSYGSETYVKSRLQRSVGCRGGREGPWISPICIIVL
jgi:hypothetical protein